jgi:pyridoxine kinase
VEATAFAGAAMFALVERTSAAGAEELELVAAQDELVAPARRFPAVCLR